MLSEKKSIIKKVWVDLKKLKIYQKYMTWALK